MWLLLIATCTANVPLFGEGDVNRQRVCGAKLVRRPDTRPRTQKHLFLIRMRKAASTTLCCALVDFALVEVLEERRPFNTACMPALAKVVSVTHLRHPVARARSDYWYVGPGAHTGNETWPLWRSWMSRGVQCDFRAGHYYDNYYTRRLLGSCGRCETTRPRLDPELPEFAAFGCIHDNDCAAKRKLTRQHLDDAGRILASFDVVYVVEEQAASIAALIDALGLADDLATALASRLLGLKIDHRPKTAPSHEDVMMPKEAEAMLITRNAYDIKLWTDARDRIRLRPALNYTPSGGALVHHCSA